MHSWTKTRLTLAAGIQYMRAAWELFALGGWCKVLCDCRTPRL